MKARDYYPTYIPRKWIHFAEHGRKYRIRNFCAELNKFTTHPEYAHMLAKFQGAKTT